MVVDSLACRAERNLGDAWDSDVAGVFCSSRSSSSSDGGREGRSSSSMSEEKPSLAVMTENGLDAERFDGAIDRRPVRVSRRYRRNSEFCFRISRSRVRFMARSEELLISRSRTLRSRRALAANSLSWSTLLWDGGLLGLCGGCDATVEVGDCGLDALASLLSSTVSSVGLRRTRLSLRAALVSPGSSEPTLRCLARGDSGCATLDRRPTLDCRGELTVEDVGSMVWEPPFDVSRKCVRGGALFTEDFRLTWSFNGDGGRLAIGFMFVCTAIRGED